MAATASLSISNDLVVRVVRTGAVEALEIENENETELKNECCCDRFGRVSSESSSARVECVAFVGASASCRSRPRSIEQSECIPSKRSGSTSFRSFFRRFP